MMRTRTRVLPGEKRKCRKQIRETHKLAPTWILGSERESVNDSVVEVSVTKW